MFSTKYLSPCLPRNVKNNFYLFHIAGVVVCFSCVRYLALLCFSCLIRALFQLCMGGGNTSKELIYFGRIPTLYVHMCVTTIYILLFYNLLVFNRRKKKIWYHIITLFLLTKHEGFFFLLCAHYHVEYVDVGS